MNNWAQNCIRVKRPDQITDKQAITVLNEFDHPLSRCRCCLIDKQAITEFDESIFLCHDVVAAFGAKVFYRRKNK